MRLCGFESRSEYNTIMEVIEHSRYAKALEKYNTHIHNEDAENAAAKTLQKIALLRDSDEAIRCLYNCLDVTSLNTDDTEERILALVEKINAKTERHEDSGAPAAICVYPSMVKLVADSLEVEDMQIAAVSAGFPHSQTLPEVKIAETALCLKDGATEIDIVLNVGKFMSGDFEAVCDEIEEQKALCGEASLKVILETGALDNASNIKKAALLAMYSGADFIKTSTGKMTRGATPADAFVMIIAIAEYYKETGRQVGFKAAGGIKTIADAMQYYTLVRELLGEKWLTPQLFRIGASSLYDALLDRLP